MLEEYVDSNYEYVCDVHEYIYRLHVQYHIAANKKDVCIQLQDVRCLNCRDFKSSRINSFSKNEFVMNRLKRKVKLLIYLAKCTSNRFVSSLIKFNLIQAAISLVL